MRKEDRINVGFVSKDWGFEKAWTKSNKYCGTFQYIVKDLFLPLHYYKTQDRTMYIHSGRLKVLFSDDLKDLKQKVLKNGVFGVYSDMETVSLGKGDCFYIPAQRACLVRALEDSEIYIIGTAEVHGDHCEIR